MTFDIEMDRKNNNTGLIIWATLPGMVTAFILGLMFWDPVEVFRVAIVTFAALLVTITSYGVLAVLRSNGAAYGRNPVQEQEAAVDIPQAVNREEKEPEPEKEEVIPEEESAEPQPHWSETAYPDPDVELGLKKTDQQ